jgi:hypothetical protein
LLSPFSCCSRHKKWLFGAVSRCTSAAKGEKEEITMKSIAIATLFVLVGTAAQAEITCDERRGCWETGARIILVDPSYVRGQSMTSHRNGTPQRVRSLGIAEETTHCQFCNRKRR